MNAFVFLEPAKYNPILRAIKTALICALILVFSREISNLDAISSYHLQQITSYNLINQGYCIGRGDIKN
jgi:hypothetical protein